MMMTTFIRSCGGGHGPPLQLHRREGPRRLPFEWDGYPKAKEATL
jgi:hypothetical protein